MKLPLLLTYKNSIKNTDSLRKKIYHLCGICNSDYRPQRSCGQGNIFTPVCHSVHRGGVSASVHAGIPHPPSRHPLEQTPPQSRHPPRVDTPPSRHPHQSRHPPEQTCPPPPRADMSPQADIPPEQTPP